MADRRIGGPGGGSDPGRGKAGPVVAAVALAGALAGAGTTIGSTGSTATPAAGSGTSWNLSAKKSDAQRSARKGNADEAWQRLSMRTLKKVSRQHLECVTHSFGQVRDYLVAHPCSSLDRVLFGISDDQGNVAAVSVAWVGFRTRTDARGFITVENRHGTGDITPLGGSLLDMADIRFSGHHYDSRSNGTTVVVAESEAVQGVVAPDVLNAIAEVAVHLPRP